MQYHGEITVEITKSKIMKRFAKIPTLTTKRLTLRKLLPSDYRDMYEYASREDVTEYLLWYPHASENQTYTYLNNIQQSYKNGDYCDWAVTVTETGKMIGTCGFTAINVENRRAEVGYVLNPEYWGNGYATEAVSAAIEFAFKELSMNRVEAHFISGNERSLAVMKRCGMTFEGFLKEYMLIKGSYKDIGFCAVTKSGFSQKNTYSLGESVGWLRKLIVGG